MMRSASFLVLLITALIANITFAVTAEDADQQAVKDVMNNYVQAYIKTDVDGITRLFADKGPLTLWGTGVDEHLTSKEEIQNALKRDFKEAATKITASGVTAMIHGNAGVSLAMWKVKYKPTGKEQWEDIPLVRVTFYIEKDGEEWQIRHAHFSSPLSSQPEGHSFPTQ